MKNKFINALLIIFGVAFFLYLAVSAVMDLNNKNDVFNANIYEAYEILEIEHSINGLIPIGTDYYYLGIDESGSAYIIKASRNWLKKNFGEDSHSLNADKVIAKGLVKEISDYEIKDELEYRLAQLEGVEYPLGMFGCIDLSYVFTAILKLATCLLVIVLTIMGIYIKKTDNKKSILSKIWLVGLAVSVILILFLVPTIIK